MMNDKELELDIFFKQHRGISFINIIKDVSSKEIKL